MEKPFENCNTVTTVTDFVDALNANIRGNKNNRRK